MQLSTAQMIAIMVAIVVIMSRVFSSIYVGFYGLLSAKLIVILHLAKTFFQKKSPKSLHVSILLRCVTHRGLFVSRSRPEGIPKPSGVCPRFVQDMAKTFLENSLNHSFLIPFHSFSFLAGTFFKKNRPNSCAFQSYSITLPSLQFIDADYPHNLRARIYVQARPTFLIGYGLIFLPVICRIPEARP